MEKDVKRKRRKDYIQHAVLSTIAISGMLVVAAVAPNALQLLGKLANNRRFPYQTRSVMTRLAAKGLVRFVVRNGTKHVELTSEGRRAVDQRVRMAELHARKPRRWDKRWRAIMFDIPERRKTDRERLRRIMVEAGFECLQDSIWVYPHDCEDLVALLKLEMHFGNHVRYAILEKLENDAALREKFKLH